MYQLITVNNVSNSPIKEFGTNAGYFQIVLQNKSHYKKVLDLINGSEDIIDSIIGKISISLSNKALIESAVAALYRATLIDKVVVEGLKSVLPNLPQLLSVPSLNSSPLSDTQLSDEEIATFFNKYLQETISPVNLSEYPLDRDGGLNPALKIFGNKNQNRMETGRWEIFVLLKNELGKLGLRSGVKSQTWDYDKLQVTEQFNFSFFALSTKQNIQKRLLTDRSGHPSLALDFTALDRNRYQALPVYTGGWLIRNDLSSQKRLQVYWSSGRYNRDLPSEQIHLLQLCIAFNLMTEYGKDFHVEFYEYNSCTMENFITMKAYGGKTYDWESLVEEVTEQLDLIKLGITIEPTSIRL